MLFRWRRKHSVWTEDFNPGFKALEDDISVDVAVIGGGITGLLTAYLLNERGIDAAVIEAERICSGVTKNTTAKITAQHDVIANKLIGSFGEEQARQYMRANTYAIEKFEEIISLNGINCDFKRCDNYVYSLDDPNKMVQEANAANKLGIDAKYTTDTELPFDVAGAVMFPNQAQFHPLKFLQEIAKSLKIYENTRAKKVEGGLITTDKGTVRAKKVVIATHYPFINVPGYYFARMHQERSDVIALSGAQDIEGMYIDENDHGFSFRGYKDLLLFGGSSHRTGKIRKAAAIKTWRRRQKNSTPKARLNFIGRLKTA